MGLRIGDSNYNITTRNEPELSIGLVEKCQRRWLIPHWLLVEYVSSDDDGDAECPVGDFYIKGLAAAYTGYV